MLGGVCEGFVQEELDWVLQDCASVFSDETGLTQAAVLDIDVGGAQPIAQPPYRIPQKFKDGVKEEVEKLLN